MADIIPPELKRIVEFLNSQMDPAEVLALELRQYQGQGLRTLVPRIYGQTEEAQVKKSAAGARSGRFWNEQTFFAELEQKHPVAMAAAREIYRWAERKADSVMFGSGSNGSASAIFDRDGVRVNLFSLMTGGSVGINYGYFQKPPFDDIEKRRAFTEKLNLIPGVKVDPGPAFILYPRIALAALENPDAMRAFCSALDWFVEQLPRK